MWYTRKGDEGYTGLLGGGRVTKDSPRIQALGALDEATSAMGLARALSTQAETKSLLLRLQRELMMVMSEVAAPDPAKLKARLDDGAVAVLEADINRQAEIVLPPDVFVTPGDTPGGAALDVARAVVRRAERHVVTLTHAGELPDARVMQYLNRLSALLYMLARVEDQQGK